MDLEQSPQHPPRQPWWTPSRMALAGIGCEVLALARTLFDLFQLAPPGALLPPPEVAIPWLIGAAIVGVGALVSSFFLLVGRTRASIGVAVLSVAGVILYRLVVLN